MAAFLTDATGDEAQLALSFIVWPGEAPDPRLVDEWLRREQAGPVTAASLVGRPGGSKQPGPASHNGSTRS